MRRYSLIAACASFLALNAFNAPIGADQPAVRPAVAALPIITAATAKHFGMFQPIALSPDLRLVAYTICDERRHLSITTNRDIGCDIQMVDLETGVMRTITQGGGNSYPTWSPDGHYLAFISDVSGKNQLYFWNRENNTLSHVSTVRIPNSGMIWTPDSKSIILLSVAAAQTSAKNAPSSDILSGGPIVPGADVVVYRSEEDLSANETAARSHITTSSPVFALDALRGDLDLISIPGGTVRQIAAGVSTLGSSTVALAPDGSSLAYIDNKGFTNDKGSTVFANVVIVDLASFTHRIVAQQQRTEFFSEMLAWSPQSDKLAWLGGSKSDTQVTTYDKETGAITAASLPTVQNMFFEITYASNMFWNADGTAYYLLGSYGRQGSLASAANAIWIGHPGVSGVSRFLSIPGHAINQLYSAPGHGGDAVIVQTTNLSTWNSGFYSINLGTRQFQPLYEKQAKIDDPIETPDHAAIAYYRQSADQSPDIWMADTAFHTERQLTHINPDFDHYVFGKAQMISWKTAAGQLLHGALMLPSDYQAGRRYPLIVYPYGSSYKSHEINNWGFGEDAANTEDLQTLATRGYAILLPDAPVRTGTPMRDIALTIMPGVDKTIAMGIADPNRLGVMGHSYGGYTVMALIAQTKRFKAAISRAGFSDWTAVYSELMPDGTAYGLVQADGNQYGLGGSPWSVLNKFISNSPYYLFDKVTTPVLIVQGTADSAVAPYNADISFVALRHLHKDVEYAKYANVDHTEDSWPFADQLDYMTRMVNWFDKYLCPNRPSETQCS